MWPIYESQVYVLLLFLDHNGKLSWELKSNLLKKKLKLDHIFFVIQTSSATIMEEAKRRTSRFSVVPKSHYRYPLGDFTKKEIFGKIKAKSFCVVVVCETHSFFLLFCSRFFKKMSSFFVFFSPFAFSSSLSAKVFKRFSLVSWEYY